MPDDSLKRILLPETDDFDDDVDEDEDDELDENNLSPDARFLLWPADDIELPDEDDFRQAFENFAGGGPGALHDIVYTLKTNGMNAVRDALYLEQLIAEGPQALSTFCIDETKIPDRLRRPVD